MIKLATFRIIPPLDTYPKIVDFAQKVPGKILLLVIFSAGISCHFDNWAQLTAFIAAMTFMPQIRPILLTIATFSALFMVDWPNAEIHSAFPQLHDSLNIFIKLFAPAGVLGLFAVYYMVVKKNKDEWYGKRPIRNLLVFYILILITATAIPLSNPQSIYLWSFIVFLGKYLWFFNYSLLDRHAKETPSLALQAGYYIPFWGGTATPFPKGAAYLRKIEARTPEQLAISQLKGVKLLYWAFLLLFFEKLLRQILYGDSEFNQGFLGISYSLGIPLLPAVLHDATGHIYSWSMNWLALIAHFFVMLLGFSAWGHFIIACCRMAGYNALRNTYKPLQSASIADFWNRFYYYFKELLAENFFYPAFLRYFKKWPKVRLIFATLAAASFGNVLFHFLRELGAIADKGFWLTLWSFRVYMFYGIVLGAAISISQLYGNKGTKDQSWLRKNIITPVYVVGFYCMLSIFDSSDRTLTLTEHFIFVLKLFNINLS